MTEAQYQRQLVKKIKNRFPGCDILTTDPQTQQGVPDLLVLYQNTWAMLEVKRSAGAPVRPNQPHYVDRYNNMSYAAFIYPENEELVLDELQQAFGLAGAARIS